MPQTFNHLSHGAASRPLPAARMGLLLWLLGLPGVVALAWTVPPAWLGFLTGADILMDGGVVASGASGLSK